MYRTNPNSFKHAIFIKFLIEKCFFFDLLLVKNLRSRNIRRTLVVQTVIQNKHYQKILNKIDLVDLSKNKGYCHSTLN